jgi:hypothetical protein
LKAGVSLLIEKVLDWGVDMRGEEKDGEKSITPTTDSLYPKEQIRTNQEPNKNKENHLTINQPHYHMRMKNNRDDSNAQQHPVTLITWEQRTIEMTPTRSNAKSFSQSHAT